MKKNSQLPYRDQLLELGKLYKINELKIYAKSKKDLTVSQIELILIKNKVRLPEQSYNKKKIAEIKFKEQVTTNIAITLCLIIFVVSLLTIRPFIKLVTSEIKFTHVAKDYKQNIKKDFSEDRTFSADKSKNKKNEDDYISLDLQITLKMFEDFKYDLNSIRLGQAVKPVYLSKLPKDLNKMKSTQKKLLITIDTAQKPLGPHSPKLKTNIIIGFLVGLFFSIAILFFINQIISN